VGYPIVDLESIGVGIKTYVYLMEEAIIKTLRFYNIASDRLEGATGVWLDGNITGCARKICAIGIRVSRGITMHGFAFNVNTDLKYFSHINPCGFVDKSVTSMQKELGSVVAIEDVKNQLKTNLAELLKLELL
jgi:lipoyl(octanoyl) transferase